MEHKGKPTVSEEKDFGDFEEVVEVNPNQPQTPGMPVVPIRVRMPRNDELIGVIMQRFGGNKMEVKCTDGKIRNCRVPGRYKRSLWLRPKDTVLVKPWELDKNKADIIFKYEGGAINQLRKRGLLNNLDSGF